MKYCVYQIDDKSNEQIINVLNKEIDFLETIKETINKKYNYKLLESISENDIKTNACFTDNYYLLVNNKQIKLVQKYKKVNNGYVYNTTKDAIIILYTWKLIPFECEYLLNRYSLLNDESSLFHNSESDTESEINNDSDSDTSLVEYVNDDNLMDKIMKNIDKLPDAEKNKPCINPFENITDTNHLFINHKEVNINGDNILKINTFNLDILCSNPSICIVAKRGSGKSWIIANIINTLNNSISSRDMLIVSKTEKISKFYGNLFPQANIMYDYDSKILKDYLDNQTKRINNAINNYAKIYGSADVNDKSYQDYMQKTCAGCVVLDNCLASKGTWMNDYQILELFYNAKHYYTTFIMTMQFPLGIKPELRCNFDYIFMLSEDFFSNQKRLYDHYGRMFPNFDVFRTVFLQLTNDYGSMVIVNRGCRKELCDKIFYYKAINPYNLIV